jgi:hypothetical protein
LYLNLYRHGEQLVLVACQASRNVALAGVQTGVLETLAINSYIMLERIGRSREHGDVTQGRHGLSRLNIQPKSAFYFRKRLLADGLIVKQVTFNLVFVIHIFRSNFLLYYNLIFSLFP